MELCSKHGGKVFMKEDKCRVISMVVPDYGTRWSVTHMSQVLCLGKDIVELSLTEDLQGAANMLRWRLLFLASFEPKDICCLYRIMVYVRLHLLRPAQCF